MANFYKSVLYDPTDTNLNTLYTAPSNARAIIQNIQIANEQGARTISVQVTDTSASQTVQVAFDSFSGVSCVNIAKGPIIIEENDVLKGRYQKIENNSIILEGSVIAIDQVKQIKFQPSRLNSASKGFVEGGLTCGGLTLAATVVIAGVSSSDLDGEAMLFAMVTAPFAALIGGVLNAISHSIDAVELLYKIDQDNWKIVTG